MNKLIIGIIIGLFIGGIIGYFSHDLINKSNPKMNAGEFEIDDETKSEVISFFDSNPTNEEVEIYCQENRKNCVYYCTEINSEYEICSQIKSQKGSLKE